MRVAMSDSCLALNSWQPLLQGVVSDGALLIMCAICRPSTTRSHSKRYKGLYLVPVTRPQRTATTMQPRQLNSDACRSLNLYRLTVFDKLVTSPVLKVFLCPVPPRLQAGDAEPNK